MLQLLLPFLSDDWATSLHRPWASLNQAKPRTRDWMCTGYAEENLRLRRQQMTTFEFKCFQPEQAIMCTEGRFIFNPLNFRNCSYLLTQHNLYMAHWIHRHVEIPFKISIFFIYFLLNNLTSVPDFPLFLLILCSMWMPSIRRLYLENSERNYLFFLYDNLYEYLIFIYSAKGIHWPME